MSPGAAMPDRLDPDAALAALTTRRCRCCKRDDWWTAYTPIVDAWLDIKLTRRDLAAAPREHPAPPALSAAPRVEDGPPRYAGP